MPGESSPGNLLEAMEARTEAKAAREDEGKVDKINQKVAVAAPTSHEETIVVEEVEALNDVGAKRYQSPANHREEGRQVIQFRR